MKRINYWDTMRGVAIFCVICIHAICSSWCLSMHGSDVEYLLDIVVMRQLVTFAVPLFLFISGYFLQNVSINSPGEYAVFLRKRLPRILVPYLVWSLVYIGYSAFFEGNIPTVKSLATTLLLGQASGPFYFILLICQFYLLLPLFLAIRKSPVFFYSIIILNIIAIIALYAYTLTTGNSLSVTYYGVPFFMWVTYFMIGLKADEIYSRLHTPTLFVLSAIFFIIAVIESIYLLQTTGGNLVFSTSTIRLGAMIFTVPVLLLILKYSTVIREFSPFLVKLGQYSFGIFFVHMLLLTFMSNFIINIPIFAAHPMLYSLVLIVSTTISCYIVGTIINRIIPKKLAKLFLGFSA